MYDCKGCYYEYYYNSNTEINKVMNRLSYEFYNLIKIDWWICFFVKNKVNQLKLINLSKAKVNKN